MISKTERDELRERCEHGRETAGVTRIEMSVGFVLSLLDALDEAERKLAEVEKCCPFEDSDFELPMGQNCSICNWPSGPDSAKLCPMEESP